MTLEVAVREYGEWKQLSRKVAGKTYEGYLKKLVLWCKKDLEEITESDVIYFLRCIQENLSESNYYYHVIALRGFVKFWSDRGVLKFSPNLIQCPRLRYEPHYAVSQLDFDVINDYFNTNKQTVKNLQDWLIFRLLWETGVRVSELCSLRLTNLSFCVGMIEARKNQNKKRVIFWSEKTDKMIKELSNHRQTYLFVSTRDNKLQPRNIQRMTKSLGQCLGLPKELVPHSFRHGKAHSILKKKGTVKDVQDILGHSNPLSSFRYLYWNVEEKQERAAKFL